MKETKGKPAGQDESMKSQKPGSERDGIRQMMCCLEKSEVRN